VTAADQSELVRLLELDYEKTTKLIEGIVGSSFTIRGWGIALVSALVGLTFQAQLWEIAGLAVVITLLIGLIDGYHSWLYSRALSHAQSIERVLGLYYAALSRGEDDPQARREFEIAILSHRFGRFSGIGKFRLAALRESRPRLVIVSLYLTLLVCAVASGLFVLAFKQNSPSKLECSEVKPPSGVYVCKQK
jgi:hypothetical protein